MLNMKVLGENFNFGFEEMDEPVEVADVIKIDYDSINAINSALRDSGDRARARDLESREIAATLYAGFSK